MIENMVEIVGPSGQVHYRRPANDPLVKEAERTAGYSVRPYYPADCAAPQSEFNIAKDLK